TDHGRAVGSKSGTDGVWVADVVRSFKRVKSDGADEGHAARQNVRRADGSIGSSVKGPDSLSDGQDLKITAGPDRECFMDRAAPIREGGIGYSCERRVRSDDMRDVVTADTVHAESPELIQQRHQLIRVEGDAAVIATEGNVQTCRVGFCRGEFYRSGRQGITTLALMIDRVGAVDDDIAVDHWTPDRAVRFGSGNRSNTGTCSIAQNERDVGAEIG